MERSTNRKRFWQRFFGRTLVFKGQAPRRGVGRGVVGLGVLMLAAGLQWSNAQAACGDVPYNKAREQGTFLWQDCDSGQWHVRVTAGGSYASFAGNLISSMVIDGVTPYSFESNDVLDIPRPARFDYVMNVGNTGEDGIDFSLRNGASACLDAGGDVVVGPTRIVMRGAFDITTLGACGAAPADCGEVAFNKATEQGTFLWQDCDTSEWHLRVTAGGSSASFTGGLTSDRALAAVDGFSMENGDVLSSASAEFSYNLFVGGTGQDGVDFALASGASGCLDAGEPVTVGPNRQTVQSPFDIQTLSSCLNDPPVAVDPPLPEPEPDPAPSDPTPTPVGYEYLWDADTTNSVRYTGSSRIENRPFPRITTGPLKTSGGAQQFSKYGVIAVKPFWFDWLASVQAIDPSTAGLRIIAPAEYQGWNDPDPCRQGSGLPFGGTGPSTQGCDVYAGHWLYAPGSTLRSAINAGTTTVQVADASRFNAGRYVVIYEGGAGAFRNAEHARVTGVNRSNNTLTLANRGYKSTAASHPAGSIIAEHVIGNGGEQDGRNWMYNMSTACPRDGSGRQFNAVLAAWLGTNYNRDGLGNLTKADVDGILFDSDFHFIKDAGHGKLPDVDNNLSLDDGISPSGVNLWGNGMDEFYRLTRQRLPDAVLVGGVLEAGGFPSLNGVQLEGWPNRNIGSSTPDYREIDGRLSSYSVQMHHRQYGPRYTEGFNRVTTKLYPYGAPGSNNRPFRFAFGLMLLDDGYFGQQNSVTTDPWWDEYAVDVVPGSATYGRAIASNPSNESQIRKHTGWMGWPLGPHYRVYNDADFAPQRDMMTNGTFDSNLTGWSGSNVNISRDTTWANRMDGAGALRISEPISQTDTYAGAAARGPTVSLTGGVEYTLAFAAKASKIRTLQAALGDVIETITVPDEWVRRVVTFEAPRTGNYRLSFNVGKEDSVVWIDSVYLFRGNADVLRRDFDNATVVVNATPSRRTVDLGGTFRRIRGTGQDPINDGSTVRQVTIEPYDSAILIRP